MLRKPIEAVLFDMDGLLIDSEAVYIEAYRDAAGEIGVEIPMTLCHAMVGLPSRECDEMIQQHYGPQFNVESFQTRFRHHADRRFDVRVPVKPGVPELLEFLGARGLPLAVASSARSTTIERNLGRAGLLGHFKAIAGRDHVERAKPHPDIYLEAARRLGAAPERCVAFEDSNVGLAAAHAAGTMAFMVPDILPPTDEARTKCLQVLPDLHAALTLLREHL